MRKKWKAVLAGMGILALVLGFGVACGGGGGEDEATLSLQLTDAATDDYQAIYVTISEIHVSQGNIEDDDSDWQVVAAPNQTYNLLELTNGVLEQLGVASLPAGQYNQLRMIIGTVPDSGLNIFDDSHPYANYLIDSEDNYHELKIPSGFQSGVKLVSPFELYEGQVTELILDFDAAKSVVQAGSSGNWLLKPTIKVLGTTIVTISGMVTDADNGKAPIEGAVVSAQIYYPEDTYPETDPSERVYVQAATISDSEGNYTLYVQPGTYVLAAYKEGYGPETAGITGEPSGIYTHDFALSQTSTGTVSGTVTVTGAGEEQVVVLSFRMDSGDDQIEVQSVNVANGGSYSVTLPAGDYSVAVSTEGFETQVFDVTVNAGGDTPLDVSWL